jgi:hypothetical protein
LISLLVSDLGKTPLSVPSISGGVLGWNKAVILVAEILKN